MRNNEKENNNQEQKIISTENLQEIANAVTLSALKFYGIHKGNDHIRRMYYNAISDILTIGNHTIVDYQVSDSYDLIQDCILELVTHIGQPLTTDILKGCYKVINHNIYTVKKIVTMRACIELADREYVPTYLYDIDKPYDWQVIQDIIKDLKLKNHQKIVIDYRLKGYSLRQIGEIMGIKASSVYDHVNAIRKKAVAIGFTPSNHKT